MRSGEDAQACIRSALRRQRRTLGLTQEAAARVLGMSRLTYHRIETGARHIHFTELAKICAAFNCHIGELVQDGQLVAAFTYAAKAILGEAPR
jgi:DNA-binding XRE family transcriptional regulator